MDHEAHVRDELEFPGAAAFGNKNDDVKRLQEWLTLSDFRTAIDKDFGPATKEALQRFQAHARHTVTGVLTEADWAVLIAPIRTAIAAPRQQQFLPRLRAVAQQHAKLRGREVGGPNAGPWVRLYMRGREGRDQLWCAGFVSFLLRQAALACEDYLAFKWRNYHEVSCDRLAADAQKRGDFYGQEAAMELAGTEPRALEVAIFLSRKTARDWVHTGLAFKPVADGGALRFDTIEGNTNQAGSSNGIEVARRIRAGKRYDFVALSLLR